MNIIEHLAVLRSWMRSKGYSAVVVSGTDPHSSEYTPDRWKQRAFISGFTGSYGTVVVTDAEAGLWTDSRYFIQATCQLEGTGIVLHKLRVPDAVDFPEWLAVHLPDKAVVCVDGLCTSVAMFAHLQQVLAPKGQQVVSEPDFIDVVWNNRPDLPMAPLYELDVKYTGRSRADKLEWLRQRFAEKHCGVMLLNSLDEIAWLLNIRSADIECTPVPIAYLLVEKDVATLFVSLEKVTAAVKTALAEDGVQVLPYSDVMQVVRAMSVTESFWVDDSMMNYALFEQITARFGESVVTAPSPVKLEKALKNDTEIEGFRKAYIKDGVAQTHFFYWLEHAMAEGQQITEVDAANKMIAFRKEQEGYIDESFEPISAYGKNAALPHYSATPEACSLLQPRGLYLLDSGAHYLEGTTDITRTTPLGPLTDEEREDYTRVLQGMIALSLASFPKGTRGAQLDVLARLPLWKDYRNYGHGTGHGVGHVLCVHEGPQDFRQNLYDQAVLPGMVTSCEPGMYVEGKYGIRHENMLLCQQEEQNEYADWLGFSTLTCTYFDTTPLVEDMLTDEEKVFIDAFNTHVYEQLLPLLPEDEARWLKTKTIDCLYWKD